MNRSVNIWARLDKTTIVIFLLLVIIGWFNIYAAVYNEEHSRIIDLSQRYGKQFVWILATFVIAVFVVVTDSRFYSFFAYFIYGFFLFLLLLVLFVGENIHGARSWFQFGSFSLQPSEFAKIGTALALAAYLNVSRHDLETKGIHDFSRDYHDACPAYSASARHGFRGGFSSILLVLYREGMSPYILISGFLMLILFFFTLLFNNTLLSLGLVLSALILSCIVTRKWKTCLSALGIITGITLLVYGINSLVSGSLRNEHIVLISVLLSGFIFAVYFYNKKAIASLTIYLFLIGSLAYVNSVNIAFNKLMKPHQKERVEILLGIKSDPHGTGYNVNQSIISIGSGGFSGKGYLKGTQTKFKFVPAQSTDFIFCTIGEEWGFMGAFVVIVLYVMLLIRLIILAERQRSAFSRIYGYGVVSVFFVHIFINIGMTIGLVPVIGIPLPFLSYGGSSLWAFTILLFIFLRLDSSRAEYLI